VAGKEEDFKQTGDQRLVAELCIRWSWNKKDDDLWWVISASARNDKLFSSVEEREKRLYQR